MTDQIEKWQEEFESMIGEENIKRNGAPFNVVGFSHLSPKEGSYRLPSIESMWQGFLMAKRNMPVIELPKPELCFTSSPSGHGAFAYVQLEPLIERLEKAGIEWISENPYPAKGE